MSDTATSSPVWGQATTNTVPGSQAPAQGEWPDGLLLFDPANNQILEIKGAESAKVVMQEMSQMETWCGELLAAKEAVTETSARIDALKAQRWPPLAELNQLEQQLRVAQARYDKAYADIKRELGDNGYLTGTTAGRELMELLPLVHRDRMGRKSLFNRKLTFVRSDKLRSHWRSYKLGAGDLGQDVSFVKDGRVDGSALREQFSRIEPKLKAEWGFAAGYLFPKLQQWAESMRVEKLWPTAIGVVQLKTEAHLFRYFAGAGLEGSWAPLAGKIAGKGNGKAEVQLASGEASIARLFPNEKGWAWSLPGVKSGNTYHIGCMRLAAQLKVAASAGASIAAEIGIELDYSVAMPGKGPAVKGRRGQAQATPRTQSLADMGAGASAGAEAFAGARASGELMGGLEYLNPEAGDKFSAIASIGPKIEGQAGAGAAANFEITYLGGKFRMRAKAGLCVGLGAKGELGLEVDARRLASFLQYLFHALLNANFEFLEVVHEEAYKQAVKLQVLMVQGVENAYRNVQLGWANFEKIVDREEGRVALMERVLSNPIDLRTCTPEAHGILLYQLTRHGDLTKLMPANTGLHLELMYRRKQAVLQICRWAQTKRQFENIVQHISPTGAKGGFKGNLDGLLRFMEIGPGDSQLDDDLLRIYARLPDQPASGYAVAPNHTSEFFAQAKVGPSPTYLAMLDNGLPLPSNFA